MSLHDTFDPPRCAGDSEELPRRQGWDPHLVASARFSVRRVVTALVQEWAAAQATCFHDRRELKHVAWAVAYRHTRQVAHHSVMELHPLQSVMGGYDLKQRHRSARSLASNKFP